MSIRKLPFSFEWMNEQPKAKCWIVMSGERELIAEHDFFQDEREFHAWADLTRDEVMGFKPEDTISLRLGGKP